MICYIPDTWQIQNAHIDSIWLAGPPRGPGALGAMNLCEWLQLYGFRFRVILKNALFEEEIFFSPYQGVSLNFWFFAQKIFSMLGMVCWTLNQSSCILVQLLYCLTLIRHTYILTDFIKAIRIFSCCDYHCHYV